MTTETALQLAGSLTIIGLSAITFRVAFGHWFCRYGLQALMVWASVGLMIAALRLADTVGVLTPTETRTWSGIGYAVAFLILFDIAVGHWVWHRHMGPSHESRRN